MPTDVYAALSDLAPHDPGHGEPVPRDFAPPQGEPDPGVGGSRVRLTPAAQVSHPRELPSTPDDTATFGRGAPRAAFLGDGAQPHDPGDDVAWFGTPSPTQAPAGDGHADRYGRPPTDPSETYGRLPGGAPADPYGAPAAADPPSAHGRLSGGDPADAYGRLAGAVEVHGRGAGEPADFHGRRVADVGDTPAEIYGGAGDEPGEMYGRRGMAGRDEATEMFDRPGGDPAVMYRRPAAGSAADGAGMYRRRDAGPDADGAGMYRRPGAEPDADGAGMYRWRGAASDGDATEMFDRPGPAVGGAGGGELPGFAGDAASGRMYDEPLPVDRVPADETVVTGGPMIDLSVPRAAPVTHRGQSRRRRTVVVVAALGAVLAGGTGYAGLRALGLGDGSTRKNAEIPLVTIAPPTDPAVPDEAPSIGIPPSASASARKSASPSASASASVSASATAPVTQPATPGRASTGSGVVVVPTPSPPVANSPHVVKPLPPTNTPAAVTARFSKIGNNSDGYVGTVTLTNPGSAAADWTVTMTAPGADRAAVVNGGVSVRLDGDQLTFTGPSLAAGDSLTYTFVVSGSLTGAPTGCSVNGAACS